MDLEEEEKRRREAVQGHSVFTLHLQVQKERERLVSYLASTHMYLYST